MIFFPISVDRNHAAICGTSIGSTLFVGSRVETKSVHIITGK
jgi:hypothetical protein